MVTSSIFFPIACLPMPSFQVCVLPRPLSPRHRPKIWMAEGKWERLALTPRQHLMACWYQGRQPNLTPMGLRAKSLQWLKSYLTQRNHPAPGHNCRSSTGQCRGPIQHLLLSYWPTSHNKVRWEDVHCLLHNVWFHHTNFKQTKQWMQQGLVNGK